MTRPRARAARGRLRQSRNTTISTVAVVRSVPSPIADTVIISRSSHGARCANRALATVASRPTIGPWAGMPIARTRMTATSSKATAKHPQGRRDRPRGRATPEGHHAGRGRREQDQTQDGLTGEERGDHAARALEAMVTEGSRRHGPDDRPTDEPGRCRVRARWPDLYNFPPPGGDWTCKPRRISRRPSRSMGNASRDSFQIADDAVGIRQRVRRDSRPSRIRPAPVADMSAPPDSRHPQAR